MLLSSRPGASRGYDNLDIDNVLLSFRCECPASNGLCRYRKTSRWGSKDSQHGHEANVALQLSLVIGRNVDMVAGAGYASVLSRFQRQVLHRHYDETREANHTRLPIYTACSLNAFDLRYLGIEDCADMRGFCELPPTSQQEVYDAAVMVCL